MSILCFVYRDDTLDLPIRCMCLCVCVCVEGFSQSYLIILKPKRPYYEVTSWDQIHLK